MSSLICELKGFAEKTRKLVVWDCKPLLFLYYCESFGVEENSAVVTVLRLGDRVLDTWYLGRIASVLR